MTVSLDADPAGFVETALNEVCFGDDDRHPLAATIDRYFAPDYRQYTDGEVVDRDGFAAHIAALRALTATGRIEVLEIVRQGNRIADRHQVTVTRHDGTTSRMEIYLFGELAADGRLRRVDEISHLLDGAAGDTELARAR
jgi:hypothetical protein